MIRLTVLIIALFFTASCINNNSMKPTDFKNTEPTMTIEQYFNGPVKAWGLLQDRSGKVTRQFKADMTGSFEEDILTLKEDFYWTDGEKQNRIWKIKKIDQNYYEGTAPDVVGTAKGYQYGSAFKFEYVLLVPVKGKEMKITFDDRTKKDTLVNQLYNVKFSDFYNSVITLRIAEELSLDLKEPYIDLVLISQNSTFIAKKAKTFNEEKKVAEKAPVDGIKIDNLGNTNLQNKEIVKEKIFKYTIKIAEFYYKDSANNMLDRIINETGIKSPFVKTISKTKYRVLLGPFNDIKKLEDSFNKIKSLDFENIEILKNV